jgi:hypothetical protein
MNERIFDDRRINKEQPRISLSILDSRQYKRYAVSVGAHQWILVDAYALNCLLASRYNLLLFIAEQQCGRKEEHASSRAVSMDMKKQRKVDCFNTGELELARSYKKDWEQRHL